MPELNEETASERRAALKALWKYDRLLLVEPEHSDVFHRTRLSLEELPDDARWLTTGRDPDVRDAGLFLVALLPPERQAHLFSTLGLDHAAKYAFARFVDGERSLAKTALSNSLYNNVIDQIGNERDEPFHELLAGLDAAIADRAGWEARLFEALSVSEKVELTELLKEVERQSPKFQSRSFGKNL